MIQSLCAMTFFVVLTSGTGFASGCEAEKQEFKRLNRQIIIGHDDPAAARAYPKLAGPVTESLHALLDEQIIAQLTGDGFPQPARVVERIRCIQGGVPGYALGKARGLTDAPTAFDANVAGEIAIAVFFDIFRGGIGASDDRPYVEVFQRSSGHWEDVGSVGADFTGHWLFVQPIEAGKPNQKWFLLWGAQFGAGNAPLRMAVAAYDGNSLTEVWSKELLAAGNVEISGDHVAVSGEDTNEKGRAEDFEEVYKAVPGGLEFVSRRITKSY